ncbi:C2 domain-containing protein [Delphinella strobiligena]|nr:C2 domain-containing protein [Delphinella strobiligena]
MASLPNGVKHGGGIVPELKQQGAFEAAQDPNSNVSAEDAEQMALAESKKAGAAAFVFDPNATAEEKKRQIRNCKILTSTFTAQAAPPGLTNIRKHKNAALVSDQDGGKPDYDLSTAPLDAALPPGTPLIADSAAAGAANGQVTKQEEWEKVGWEPRFGNPGDKEEETYIDHQDSLESKLPDNAFGQWYHNAAVIVFATLASYVTTMLGGGLAWCFIIMACCGTYYRTSIRRVRRNFRDDLNRELAKARLETDHETLEWINSFLVKFWPIYAPVLCATIVNSVDQVLSTSTPAFLDSMRMKFFTLGTKPPRLEHVKTYPKADDDIVLMDWKFSFTPNDTADLTARQVKNKVNPKVVLEIRLGKGMVSKGMDIIVEDMAFSGLMRVKVKLQIPFPHIEKVEICFLERPKIDYVCKPLGGDTFGFDINFIPGLESFIQEQIHTNLGPMMYDPNVFPIEIAKMLAGNPVDQAIGVLQVTFHGAQGLKNPDKFSGTPDPYATVSINARDVLGKTKTVFENANPRWSETVNVVISSLKDSLTLQVYDYNEYRKDKELGTATFALDQLEAEHVHENQQLEVMANGRPRGVIQADIRFFPVLQGQTLPDGTLEPPPESTNGILKFTVECAKELDGSKSMIGQLNPYAVLLLNGKEVHISKKLKRTNNPIWPDATKEMLITDRKKAKLGLVIKDDRDIAADPILGTYQLKLDDMLELMAKGQEWYNLAGTKTGRVKMLAQWKPVALSGVAGTTGGYVMPIGVMRFHFRSAKDLKNLETMGKSDPYARVLLSGIQKGRTVTFKNNLNPDWDEVIYVPVHSTREKLVLEVMDEESLGKDRSLGVIEIATADYIHQEESGLYATHDTKRVHAESLRMGPKAPPKGILNFTVSFFPTINVADPADEEEDKSSTGGSVGRPSVDGASLGHVRSNTAGTISSLNPLKPPPTPTTEMMSALAKNEADQESIKDGVTAKREVPKIKLTVDDLQEYESGLFIFKLIDGEFSQPGYHLEVLIDDNLFPSYTSAKTRSKTYAFNEVGDAMIRELDLSKITLRLVEEVDNRGEDDEKHVKAKLTGNTLDVLRRCLYQETQLILKDKEGRDSKVTVSGKYLPIKMQLDPSESFNNQGNLRVEVLDAADLPAADRNGYSDPYCKFIMHGKEVFKTKVQKKTLHPAWNEFFEVPVRSRTAAEFEVVVYDWDFGDKADLLGKAVINLDVLEPFRKQEVALGLDGKSGTVRLSMLFKPDYVTRSRQGSSTMAGTFAMPGKIVGAPVKGVGKGAVFVGGAVGGGLQKGASFLGRGFRTRKNTNGSNGDSMADASAIVDEDRSAPFASDPTAMIPESPPRTTGGIATSIETPGTPSSRGVARSATANSPGGTDGRPSTAPDTGTAVISIASAAGYPSGTKIEVRVAHDSPRGLKEVIRTKPLKTKGDSVSWEDGIEKRIPCAADAQFRISVREHHLMGGGAELGEASFFVDDSSANGSEKAVTVGPGSVTIRTRFEAGGGYAGDLSSVPSRDAPASRGLGAANVRKSFMGRRDRSVTPNP